MEWLFSKTSIGVESSCCQYGMASIKPVRYDTAMLSITIVTLFPDSIQPYLNSSMLARAQKQGLLTLTLVNPRAFTQNPHRKVDDTPYGGGAGMVMQCQPLDDALASLQPVAEPAAWVMTSPAGQGFDQAKAQHWASTLKSLVIVCGHYEGIDARLLQLYPQLQPVSVGPFVLTGGELAACIMADAVTRLIPGVVGNPDSLLEESHSQAGWLEYPQYTKPAVYKGLPVPPVLLSGNHKAINTWREQNAHQTP
jgi:tRNA (guanine37-N1)-methyltransferase